MIDQFDAPEPFRSATLRALKIALEPLLDGPRLYEFTVNCPDPAFGTTPGREYSLGVTDDDGSYRSVLYYRVRDDGSVDPVRSGELHG